MVDETDNDPPRSASARKITPGGDAAAKGDSPVEATSGSDESAPTPTRPRRTTPFWRTGRFWLAVIVLEIVLALLISFQFERSATEVDLTGGDLAAFCDQARALRAAGLESQTAAGAAGGSVGDPAVFRQEREAYLALVAVAPPDLVPDLERLADLSEYLVDTSIDIGERKAADPAYSGVAEISAAIDRVAAQGAVASSRVNIALEQGCGITAEPAAPSTTSGPMVTVPPTTDGPAVTPPTTAPR